MAIGYTGIILAIFLLSACSSELATDDGFEVYGYQDLQSKSGELPLPLPDDGGESNNPPPTEALGPTLVYDLFSHIGNEVASGVDRYYGNRKELLDQRSNQYTHFTDSCPGGLAESDRFSDRIAQYVAVHLSKFYKPRVDTVGTYFGLSTDLSKHSFTSLKSHPMCEVTSASLAHSLGSQRVPEQNVIDQLNQFSRHYNNLRDGARNGDMAKSIDMIALWSKVMGCLSYVESLSTADSRASESIAAKHAPTGYRKPSGVGYYEDPRQSEESRLNIGLYQFTPDSSGNINSCIRQWNEWYPSCFIDQKSSRSEMIRILGSSFQSFNAFCGVNKVAQSLAIQINTSRPASSHLNNQASRRMKSPGERCVSPFFLAGKTYNHFGPLQNSTGTNLKKLMACVLAP